MKIDLKIKGNIILLILIIIYPLYTSIARLLSFGIHKGYKENVYGQPETIFQLLVYSLIFLTLFAGGVFVFFKNKIGIPLVRGLLITMLLYLVIKTSVAASLYVGYIRLMDIIAIIIIILTLFNIRTKNLINFFEPEELNNYKEWSYAVIISIIYGVFMLYVHW